MSSSSSSLVSVPDGVFHMELPGESLFLSHTYKHLNDACMETRAFYLSNMDQQWCCMLCGIDEFGFLPQEDSRMSAMRLQFRKQSPIWKPQPCRLVSQVFNCDCKGVIHQACLESFLDNFFYLWAPCCKKRIAIHPPRQFLSMVPAPLRLYEPRVLAIMPPIEEHYTFFPNPQWYEKMFESKPCPETVVLYYLRSFLTLERLESLQVALEEEELQEIASYFDFNQLTPEQENKQDDDSLRCEEHGEQAFSFGASQSLAPVNQVDVPYKWLDETYEGELMDKVWHA